MHLFRQGKNWKVIKVSILANSDYLIRHNEDGREKELGKIQLPEMINILKMSPSNIDNYCEEKIAC